MIGLLRWSIMMIDVEYDDDWLIVVVVHDDWWVDS